MFEPGMIVNVLPEKDGSNFANPNCWTVVGPTRHAAVLVVAEPEHGTTCHVHVDRLALPWVQPVAVEDVAVGLFEAWTGLPLCWCDAHGWQVVTHEWSGPGFTGAPIGGWTLACGCSDVDLSADTLEWVR